RSSTSPVRSSPWRFRPRSSAPSSAPTTRSTASSSKTPASSWIDASTSLDDLRRVAELGQVEFQLDLFVVNESADRKASPCQNLECRAVGSRRDPDHAALEGWVEIERNVAR